MNNREPLLHWINFTVPQLKEILMHCQALEELGIAQDEKMVASIQKDIALQEKKPSQQHLHFEATPLKPKRQILQIQA